MKEIEKQSQSQEEFQEIKIDLKSKIFLSVIGFLIVGSVAATYWRIVVKRDYIIQAQIECDPETEECFIWECDPASTVEGEACTGDEESDIWYYKIFRRNAKNIPLCDPNDENCAAYVCDPGEEDCSEELCSSENVPEGESCNDPEQYLLENPPEEESECAPDDEECLAEEAAAECEEGDEECLGENEETECEEGDENCVVEEENTEGECAPDDEECLDAEGEEDASTGEEIQGEEINI